MGWVKGDNDGLFHPERTVNFAEASKILMVMHSPDKQETPWYRPYVNYMSWNHFIPPFIQTVDQNLNRGETAELLLWAHNLTDENKCEGTFFSWSGDMPVKKIDLGGYYRLDDGKVSYWDNANNQYRELAGANYNSFKDIHDCRFFTDKNHIYFDGKILDLADVKNFKAVGPYFWGKDGKVYYVDGYSNEIKLLEAADPGTFHEYRNSAFYIDKNYVYNNGKKIEGSDGSTFSILADHIHSQDGLFEYGRDKNLLYLITSWEGTSALTLSGVDLSSFKIVADRIWEDKNNVYFWDKKMDNMVPGQLKFLGRLEWPQNGLFLDFFKDNEKIYYSGIEENRSEAYNTLSVLEKADVTTFKVLSSELAQDRDHRYTFEKGNFMVEKR